VNARRVMAATLGCLAFCGATTRPAHATTITFDFNSLSSGVKSTNGPSDPIDSYMTHLWGSPVNVSSGTETARSAPEDLGQKYLGNTEDYVGRGKDSGPVDRRRDTYLFNRWDEPSIADHDRIIITFAAMGISSFSVDWEIFPVTKNSTDNADITIYADGQELLYASLPPTGNMGRENGMLGVFSSAGYVAPPGGWHTLTFVDWTSAPVGIDNLEVDPWSRPPSIPEPGSGALVGIGLVALAALGHRTR
jgi:hypothetical protein